MTDDFGELARLMDENRRLRAALIEMGAAVQGVDLPRRGSADSDHTEAQVRSGERWTAIEMLKVAARDKVAYLSAATRWAVAGVLHLEEKLAVAQKRLAAAEHDLGEMRRTHEFNMGVIESERERHKKQANGRLCEMEAWRALASCRRELLAGAKGKRKDQLSAAIEKASARVEADSAPSALLAEMGMTQGEAK